MTSASTTTATDRGDLAGRIAAQDAGETTDADTDTER